MIIATALLALAALLNLVAALAVRSELAAVAPGASWVLPTLVYAAATITLASTAVLRWTSDAATWRPALVLGLLLTMAGPLTYGWIADQFTLTHHLVRLVIVIVVGVVVWLL